MFQNLVNLVNEKKVRIEKKLIKMMICSKIYVSGFLKLERISYLS